MSLFHSPLQCTSIARSGPSAAAARRKARTAAFAAPIAASPSRSAGSTFLRVYSTCCPSLEILKITAITVA